MRFERIEPNTVLETSQISKINEYIYRFNCNPNYECIFDLDGLRFRANVLTNDEPEHGVATIEIWNFAHLHWNHIHTIPGSLMRSRTKGLADDELNSQAFAEDFVELVAVARLIMQQRSSN